jgi:hypothetical protein
MLFLILLLNFSFTACSIVVTDSNPSTSDLPPTTESAPLEDCPSAPTSAENTANLPTYQVEHWTPDVSIRHLTLSSIGDAQSDRASNIGNDSSCCGCFAAVIRLFSRAD